ncbi:MAG: molybdopterin molybdotransferase MoeA [Bacteroidales bacterium]
MISFENAFTKSQIVAQRSTPGILTVRTSHSSGFVLKESVIARQKLPSFSKAAVDGYAILKDDIHKALRIAGIIAAGQNHNYRLKPGECYHIMTGAATPANADMVVMQEDVEKDSGRINVLKVPTKSNIIKEGEDADAGTTLLSAGTYLQPRHSGILATAGYAEIQVYEKPSVGVLNTGSELVEAGQKTTGFEIINSNGPQTIAQLRESGLDGHYLGIVPDDAGKTYDLIRQGTEQNDILIITGGVSEGHYDLVGKTLKDLGFQILFDKVAVQPGKPTTLAARGQKAVIGLPGNPVSSFVIFKLLVEPFIVTWMKGRWENPGILLPLGKPVKHRNSKRDKWIPINIINGEAIPVAYHGSAHIHAISFGTHIMRIAAGTEKINKGDFVRVRPL